MLKTMVGLILLPPRTWRPPRSSSTSAWCRARRTRRLFNNTINDDNNNNDNNDNDNRTNNKEITQRSLSVKIETPMY